MSLLPLIAAVFAASLLGSFHCAGMCGAFIVVSTSSIGNDRRGWRGAAAVQAAYHAGRLVSYMLLGAAAGAAGSLVNVTTALAGVRPLASAVAGATIAAFGVVSLLRLSGANISRFHLPASWMQILSRLTRLAIKRPPLLRAGMIGLFTTLLPCGWLYAFAVTAAGTGSPVAGAITMAAFWAGTVPALAAVGVGARGLLGPLGRKMPALTAAALVVVGLYTLTGRSMLDPVALANRARGSTTGASVSQNKPACCAVEVSRDR